MEDKEKLEQIKELVLKQFEDCIGCGGTNCIGCQSHEGWERCMDANILSIIMGEQWLQEYFIKKVEELND